MALRLEELAKTIDYTLLAPTATVDDVDRLCEEARQYHVASVCVFPCFVTQAVERLRGCDVKVCTVVSFPYGADATRTKVAAAEQAVSSGANELDVVANVPVLRSGELRLVRDELAALVRAVRVRSVNAGGGIVLVKVALDCAHLDDGLKRLACKIAEDAGADFVQASTGAGAGGATVHDIELLRECLPESVGVKASGDIETAAAAEAVIAAGAGRIGTAHAPDVLRGFERLKQAS